MTRVEVIAVGNELLSGDILDTDFQALARRLTDLGVEVTRHVTVGDDRAAIAAQLKDSMARADFVVMSGGLGPTSDDLTRHGVAEAFGVELFRHEPSVEAIRARFKLYGVGEMPSANEVQAMFPIGATVLANDHGTAPGFQCTGPGGQVVVVLPGPPREFGPMMERHLVPLLEARKDRPVLKVRRLRTIGIGESALAEKLAGWPFGVDGVDIGYYPQDPGVDLKLTARGRDAGAAGQALEAALAAVRGILGHNIYGEDAITLAEVVGGLLRQRGATLSVAESCTGGLVGSIVTSVAGSSDYFDGGVVTYSDASKESWLGVPRELLEAQGAVSEEVARAMAEGVRRARGTTWGLALTGIAGPGGGSAEKPVGLVWLALAGSGGTESRRTHHAGARVFIQRRAAMMALDLLRRRLITPR